MAGSTMYVLASEPAVLRDKKTYAWLTADVRTKRCIDLFALYRVIEVALTDKYGNKMTVNLYNYENELRESTLTVSGWIAQLGNRALNTTAGYPSLKLQTANYLPIGFSLESIRLAKRGYDPSHVVPVEDYADVVVAHPKVSPRHLHEYTLCSVGGYYVPSTYHDYGMRLYSAGDIIRRSGDAVMGMLNFENIGKVTKIPVMTNMLHKVDDSMSYIDSAVINVGVPIKNKTVGIVIGGHLHLLDDLVKVIGDQTIMISLRRMRYVERVLASRNHLDLSFMGLDTLDVGALVSGLTADENVVKYLTCQATFVVLIDNPNVYIEEKAIDQTARWGQYALDGEADLGGLYDQYGLAIDYWPKWEMGIWSLDTLREADQTNLVERSNWLTHTRFNDAAIGANMRIPTIATMKYIKART